MNEIREEIETYKNIVLPYIKEKELIDIMNNAKYIGYISGSLFAGELDIDEAWDIMNEEIEEIERMDAISLISEWFLETVPKRMIDNIEVRYGRRNVMLIERRNDNFTIIIFEK